MVRKLNNFDDWIDYFRYWQDSIGLRALQGPAQVADRDAHPRPAHP